MKILTSLILLLTLSCVEANKSYHFNKVAVIAEVEQILDEYHRDIRTSGLTAEFIYLDQSADFFWVPPGYNSPLSYDSVETILRMNAKAFNSVNLTWDSLNIFPLSGEIATYAGIVSGVMIDTAGIESRISIIESGTIIKRETGWKLLSGQSTILED